MAWIAQFNFKVSLFSIATKIIFWDTLKFLHEILGRNTEILWKNYCITFIWFGSNEETSLTPNCVSAAILFIWGQIILFIKKHKEIFGRSTRKPVECWKPRRSIKKHIFLHLMYCTHFEFSSDHSM